MRSCRRRQHVDAAGRGEAPSPLRCGSGQAARARSTEQERDEPPRYPAKRIGRRSDCANVRARGSSRTHRARALPLAGVPVGPLRRQQPDAEVGHGLARATRRGAPAGAPVPRPATHGDHRTGRDGRGGHVLESISGHLSRRMLEHYSHIRIDAKRQALDALDAARRATAPNGDGNGDGANETEIQTVVEVGDDLTSQSRHSLVLRGSPPAGKLLIPLARRHVRVVEGARLENESGDAHQVTPNHLFAQSIQRLPATRCLLM